MDVVHVFLGPLVVPWLLPPFPLWVPLGAPPTLLHINIDPDESLPDSVKLCLLPDTVSTRPGSPVFLFRDNTLV